MRKYIIVFTALIFFISCTDHRTPLVKSDYKKLTSYNDMINFIKELSNNSDLMELDTLALSTKGRAIPFLRVSLDKFGSDSNKIKVMIFAQQHGNEHSGKEAMISIVKRIYESKMTYLLSKFDLILIPQINPDGSEKDERRNGNNADLNRDHLVLSQPESIGLHKLFHKYKPEVVLDVHEYRPFSKSWEKYGYQKNWDVQFGTLTNINVAETILDFQRNEFIPFIKEYLENRDITFNQYVVGGPPNEERMRYSTIDINDGRQSFGILNTMSFILEGLNGRTALENIEHRTESQVKALLGFLEFVYENKDQIKKIVETNREELSRDNYRVSIRMEHVKGSTEKHLTFLDFKSDNDTTLLIENFHEKVISKLDVEKPKGYLIPKNLEIMKKWLDNHSIEYSDNNLLQHVYEYEIQQIINSVDEELDNSFPEVVKKPKQILSSDYFYIPSNQLHSNMLVLALEPQSQIGLMQYEEFRQFLVSDKSYKILRLE